MQNSDLVEIISVLTGDERDRLPIFLEKTSPSFKPDAIRLVNHVLQCILNGKSSELSRKDTYAFLFPRQDWVDNKLEKLMSEALSIVRQFAALEISKRQVSDLRQALFLQMFYNERGLVDKSRTAYRQIDRAKIKRESWTAEDYFTSFLSEKEELYAQSVRNRRKDDVNLKNAMSALSEYYLVEHLWLVCYMLNQRQVASLDISSIQEMSFLDLESPRLRWFFKKPLGQLFKKAIFLLNNEEQENVQDLRDFVELLRSYESVISNGDMHLFEMTAINLGIRRGNNGNYSYVDLVVQIQKDRVNSGRIYIEKGQISATEFLSIFTTGLRLNDLEWVKTFIESHKKKILGVMPSEQYYEFALANYYYYIKEYQETRRILMTSDYEDIQCRISARILEIKALFELSILENADYRVGEYLEDRVEAAILFFFRLKDAEPRKKRMGKRFADTMKRILHAHGNRDAKRLEKIIEDVKTAELIAERQWLTSIIADLIKHLKKS